MVKQAFKAAPLWALALDGFGIRVVPQIGIRKKDGYEQLRGPKGGIGNLYAGELAAMPNDLEG